jgi:coenzyme F420-reducing hydrogenase delta subunit
MTLFIEGLAFPLNQKNANGWGIPETESDNAINSLKASVLKICPGEAHACDFSEDPYGRIGRIVDAWQKDNGIYVRAAVTDSMAARKLKEGTWDEHTWSVYADSKIDPKLNDGWAGGFTAKALTLVKNPAWTQAQFTVAASADGGVFKLHTFSQFQLIASQEEGETITEELEKLKTELSEKDKLIEELKVSASKVPEFEKQVGELTASVKELEGKLEEKSTLVASLEKGQAGSVPMDQVKVLIASAIEEHDKETAEKAILSASRERFVNARKELGLETKDTEFTSLSASDFDAMTEIMTVNLSASAQVQYPAGNVQTENKACTGAYNPKTGAWE